MDNNVIKKLSPVQLAGLAARFKHEPRAIKAVINVETPGYGFSRVTGKILIQFEPHWFKKKFEEWKANQGTWAFNGISDQTKEWLAFNNAFSLDPLAAMESTSIGLMQVMGFHFETLGFKTVGDMWEFGKYNEANQLELGLRFIRSNPKLDKALREKDWEDVAYYYNGAGYKQLAERTKSTPYDKRLKIAYLKLA